LATIYSLPDEKGKSLVTKNNCGIVVNSNVYLAWNSGDI
jgi:hypothetical protein